MTDMVPLDKHVPLPIGNPRTGRKTCFPWRQCAIGDLWFMAGRTSVSLDYWKRNTGFEYVTRAVVERGVTGMRIWRSA